MIPHSTTPLTDAELRRQFEWALGEALQGRSRTELALSGEVQDALLTIMDASPDVPDSLIDAARSAFAAQRAGEQGDPHADELLALLRQSRQSA